MATNTTNSTSNGNSTFIISLFNAPPADSQAQAGIQWKVHCLESPFSAFMVLFEIKIMSLEPHAGQTCLIAPLSTLDILTYILIAIFTLLLGYRNDPLQLTLTQDWKF